MKYYREIQLLKKLKEYLNQEEEFTQEPSIPKVMNGLGLAILSTPKGMSDIEARKNNVGGEIICKVF